MAVDIHYIRSRLVKASSMDVVPIICTQGKGEQMLIVFVITSPLKAIIEKISRKCANALS